MAGGPDRGHCWRRPVSFERPVRSGPCHCGQSAAGGWAAATTVNPSMETIVNSFIAQPLPGPRRHENAQSLRDHGISDVTPEYKNIWENSEHVAIQTSLVCRRSVRADARGR